jgi:hypothetical protein
MKKRIFVYSLLLVASSVLAQAQTFKFDFSSEKKNGLLLLPSQAS